MPGLLAYVRARAFPLYSRALLLRIVAPVPGRLLRPLIPSHLLSLWLIIAPEAGRLLLLISLRLLSFIYAMSPDVAAHGCSGRGCCSSDDPHRMPLVQEERHRLSIWLLVAPLPFRSLAARFVSCRVHFYKNIYYFGYFIHKNVQNARYFAFFAQNIWQFQKNVLPLQRI